MKIYYISSRCSQLRIKEKHNNVLYRLSIKDCLTIKAFTVLLKETGTSYRVIKEVYYQGRIGADIMPLTLVMRNGVVLPQYSRIRS